MKFCLLFVACVLPGQVIATITLQPLEAFRAVYIEKLSGVALYEILACNHTDAAVVISGGQLIQAAWQRGTAPVSDQMVEMVGQRARRQSKLYRLARTGKWLSFGMAVAIGTDAVKIKEPAARAAPIFVAGATDLLEEAWRSKTPVFVPRIDPAETIRLPLRGSCVARPFLGKYVREPVAPIDVR